MKDTPERFSRAAVRTEHRIVTGTYANDVGLHANGLLYEAAVNLFNLPLTIANLEFACATMAAFTDANGEPIMNRAKYLVVPPSLEFTARQILTSAMKMWAGEDQAAMAAWPMTNVISQYGLVLVIDPYLPVVDAVNGDTAWYLFADPRDISALEFAHLVGHERPEICMKSSDKVNIGGGEIGPMSGDFATDNVLYRVRLVFGGCKLDWRATWMSSGEEES